MTAEELYKRLKSAITGHVVNGGLTGVLLEEDLDRIYQEASNKMTRQEANERILQRLRLIVDENPDLRFNQILSALAINPQKDLYEEPQETLEEVDWDVFDE